MNKSTASIDWSPLKRRGSNFRTHRLIELDPDVMAFEPTKRLRIFYSLFVLAGFAALLFAGWHYAKNVTWYVPEVIGGGIIGVLFLVIGLVMYRSSMESIVFDRKRGYYWRGRKDPDAVSDVAKLKQFVKLSEVGGVQIVGELIQSDDSSFLSFELNLVLHDGSRLNVVDHANGIVLREEALVLAEFLGIAYLNAQEGDSESGFEE